MALSRAGNGGSVASMSFRDAAAAAERAAQHAQVTVRTVSRSQIQQAQQVLLQTWGAGHAPDPSILQVFAHAGDTVFVATDASGDIVGVTVGFLGLTDGIHVHSHMTAVIPGCGNAGVGYALKLHQRAACLDMGVGEVRWTFDPLIRRNAHFNLVRLGAEVLAYHPDFYGYLDDPINRGDHTDRFEVRWRLDSPRVRAALAGFGHSGWSGEPDVTLDEDFEALRHDRPDAAAREREESGSAFGDCFARGLRPELVAGSYLFTADDPDEHASRGERTEPTG